MRITTAVLTIVDAKEITLSSPLCLTLAQKIHNLDNNSFTNHSPSTDYVFPMRS